MVAETLDEYMAGFGRGDWVTGGAAVTPFMVPGMGPLFALGSGASAVPALVGPDTGSALGKVTSAEAGTDGRADEAGRDIENAALFQKILKAGHSLILV